MLVALALLVGTPTGWQLPDQATQVQVLRIADGVTTPFVAVAEVLPTERIKACSGEVRIGSTDTCPQSGRAPGRTDIWFLKSEVFPASSGKSLTVRWGPPQYPDGTEYTDVTGYKLTIRRQDCDPVSPGCEVSSATEEAIKGREARSYEIQNVTFTACASVQAFNEAGDGAPSPEVCPKVTPPAVSDVRIE